MSESAEQIHRHIQILSDFEQKFGEYITAIHNDQIEGRQTWSRKEYAERKREIQMLATRADLAMKASGVGQWALAHPPAIGGGVKSTDLPSQVFDFQSFGFNDDGLAFQRKILDRIPSQISGLEVRLEEAEAVESSRPAQWEPKARGWPTVIGRIRHVPPVIGLVADLGGFVVVVGFVGRLVGVW